MQRERGKDDDGKSSNLHFKLIWDDNIYYYGKKR